MARLRVLLVDDEREFVDTLCLRLHTRGMEAACVYSADEALERLGAAGEDAPIDVVVLDLRMPGMSGLEAMRHLRRRWPAVGRILLTGHGGEDVAVAVKELGGHYLRKPVEIERLVAILYEAASSFGSGTGDGAATDDGAGAATDLPGRHTKGAKA